MTRHASNRNAPHMFKAVLYVVLLLCYMFCTSLSAYQAPIPNPIVSNNDAVLSGIYLQFDLKVVTPPVAPNTQWFMKVESDNLDTAVVFLLDKDVEYAKGPVVGEWRTFRFDMLTITRKGTGINLDAIEKVLVFPYWQFGQGAVYQLDNVQIVSQEKRENIFVNTANPDWPAWDCCGGTTPQIVTDTDSERGRVLEFRINQQQGTVLGFNRSASLSPSLFKISSLSKQAEVLLEEGYVDVTANDDDILHFSHILHEDLISLGTIYAIVKDPLGFLWFGGSDGLARYDGYTLKTYKHDKDNASSLSNNSVWDMLIDSSGDLWIATEVGLNRFDYATQAFERFLHNPDNPNSLSENTTKVLFEDSQGILWVGTYRAGLNRFDKASRSFTSFQYDALDDSSISSDEINAIAEDANGMIWVGTEAGLNSHQPGTGKFTRYYQYWGNQNSLTDNTILSLAYDRQDRLWVGTYDGINLFDTQSGDVTRYQFAGNPTFDVVDIAFDDDNVMLLATGEALFKFDVERLRYSKHVNNPLIKSSFEGKFAASLFKDGNNWWLGTFPVGINYIDYNKNLFSTIVSQPDKADALNHNSILSVTEDNNGNLWLGTDGGGLNFYNRQTGKFHHLMKNDRDGPSLNGNAVLSTTFDQDGNLWISSWHSPLSIYNPASDKFIHQTNTVKGLPVPDSLFIWDMLTDSRGDIWLATLGSGLMRFDAQTQTYYSYLPDDNDATSFGSNVVWSIFEDNQDRMWFGTSDGLVTLNQDRQTFTTFRYEEGLINTLSNNIVLDINQDSFGNLWLGTRGGGLNKLDLATSTFTTYTSQNGLPDDVVTAILNDASGNLWLSTFNGLCNFDLSTQNCRNFRNIGGMQSDKFNIGSGLRLQSGELLFGGIDGFTLFEPTTITKNNTVPPVVFTDFQIANQSVQLGAPDSPLSQDIMVTERISLNHLQSMFSFEFSALDYHNPSANQYAYFLQGYDKQWNEIGNRRRATYTNLDPGTYRFLVKGSNSEGIWNEQPAAVDIEVLAPPWQSWWAYGLYTLLTLSILSLIGYLQYKKLQERNQLKLALWASGDEMWDIDLVNKAVLRQNTLSYLDRQQNSSWMFTDIGHSNIHPEDQKRALTAVKEHLDNKTDYFEVLYRAKSLEGDWIWLLDRGKVTSRNITGAPVRFSGTTKNIHQLKTTEAKLIALNHELENRVKERTYELQQSNEYLRNAQAQLVESEKMASLATVIIGVSHELNTPAGVAITAVSQLKHELDDIVAQVENKTLTSKYFDNFKNRANTAIELIRSSLARSVGIIQSFKEISVDQNKHPLRNIKLGVLIDQAVAETLSLNGKTGLHNVSVDCDPEIELRTFPDILSSTLHQLIKNAQQHGFADNEPVRMDIRVTEQEHDVELVIRDEGKGMDNTALTQLFDPFFTTDRGRNIGLGMFVAYNQIYTLLNGTIKCHSSPGKGTTFTITLPLNYSEERKSA